MNIFSTSLKSALGLSAADRRWIDFLTQTVNDTWDDSDPSRPKTMGFLGSEEFIRLQFEEYLLALLSSIKYHLYLQTPNAKPMPNIDGDPTSDYNTEWIHAWQQTSNFSLFNRITDVHLFDVVEPKHPTAGNLNIEDVQRRITQQIQTLHLDERFATGKETVTKHLASGQRYVSTAFANLKADIEARREAQRKGGLEAQASTTAANAKDPPPQAIKADQTGSPQPTTKSSSMRAPDLATAQASVQAAGQKAGVYLSSWGNWAMEKKRNWEENRPVERDSGSSKDEPEPTPGKVTRWSSFGSSVSFGKASGSKEEKGADGIGRLDAK